MSLKLENELRQAHDDVRGLMKRAADEIDALRGAIRLLLPHVQFVIARNPTSTQEAQHAYGVAEQLLSR